MSLGRVIIGAAMGLAVAGAAALWLTPANGPVEDAPPPLARPEPEPVVAAALRADPAPAAEAPTGDPAETAAGEAEPTGSAPVDAPPAQDADPSAAGQPRLDIARVEADGQAVFAGVAEPNAVVELRRDGVAIATATADAEGGFVAFGAVEGDDAVTRLDLVARPQGAGGGDSAPVSVIVAQPDASQPEAAPIVAQTTPQGVDLLQPRALGPDETLSLDSVSFGAEGDVALTGRGPPGAPLLIFANARMIAEATIDPRGRWDARSGDLAQPGDYTLRVAVLDDAGQEVASVTSPFVRPEPARNPVGPGEVLIQPGDTLWAVAQNLYGAGERYTLIYRANRDRVRDPDLIYPGQILSAPPQ